MQTHGAACPSAQDGRPFLLLFLCPILRQLSIPMRGFVAVITARSVICWSQMLYSGNSHEGMHLAGERKNSVVLLQKTTSRQAWFRSSWLPHASFWLNAKQKGGGGGGCGPWPLLLLPPPAVLLLQAAFKRPAGTDSSGCTTTAGPQCEHDWDLIKAEDKTLVHQVSNVSFLPVQNTKTQMAAPFIDKSTT